MSARQRPFALVTGASTGIGFELARQCVVNGFDVLIAAEEPAIHQTAGWLRTSGADVRAIEVDFATLEGIDTLYAATLDRRVDALLANAGRGADGPFLTQPFDAYRGAIDATITGTLSLVQKVGRDMKARRSGRILIAGSVGDSVPGTRSPFSAGAKAFLDAFSFALRAELKKSQVTVTCLMPDRDDQDDPGGIAKDVFEAMMRGEAEVVRRRAAS